MSRRKETWCGVDGDYPVEFWDREEFVVEPPLCDGCGAELRGFPVAVVFTSAKCHDCWYRLRQIGKLRRVLSSRELERAKANLDFLKEEFEVLEQRRLKTEAEWEAEMKKPFQRVKYLDEAIVRQAHVLGWLRDKVKSLEELMATAEEEVSHE